MKGAHREGKDSASCGHKSAGGCPTVFINGFPAMRAYGDSDRAGGQLLGPGAKNVFVGNARLSLKGDSVLSHGRGEHASATIVTGSPDVLAAPNPPVERWESHGMSLDQQISHLAGLSLGGALRFLNHMGKGAWDLLVKLGTSIREHPLETAGLVLLTMFFPELGLLLAAGGAAWSAWQIGGLTWKLLNEDLSQEQIDALARQYGHVLGELGLSVSGYLGALKQLRLLNRTTLASIGPLLGQLQKAIREFNGPEIARILHQLGSERLAGLWKQAGKYRDKILRRPPANVDDGTPRSSTVTKPKRNLDADFGKARYSEATKQWELDPDTGMLLENPYLQIGPGIKLVPGKSYVWCIDDAGNMRVGPDLRVGNNPNTRLGHPSLFPYGKMRMAGELHWDVSKRCWIMDTKSGRIHMIAGPPPTEAQLANAVKLLEQDANLTGRVVGVPYEF